LRPNSIDAIAGATRGRSSPTVSHRELGEHLVERGEGGFARPSADRIEAARVLATAITLGPLRDGHSHRDGGRCATGETDFGDRP